MTEQKLSRRDFLRLSGRAGAGLVAYGVNIPFQQITPDLGQTPVVRTPEPMATPEYEQLPMEFGFNTHLHAEPGLNQNLDLEQFKRSVDFLVQNNMQWIRFDIREDQVINMSGTTHMNWKERSLETYAEALDYAKSRGLKTIVPIAVPGGITQGLTHEEYIIFAGNFYGELAQQMQGKIDIWQIFNEPDVHNYRNYGEEFREMPEEYLQNFAEVVAVASNAIHAVDPNTQTTVNMSWWFASGRDLQNEGRRLFGVVADSIDVITLDFYPDVNLEAIIQMPQIISDFSAEFHKPVIVGELGLPTSRFSEEDQGKYMGLAIGMLRSAPTQPQAVLLYELVDQQAISGNEGSFGFLDAAGTPKASWEMIQPWIDPPEVENGEPTPTAVG